jgi:hypothetical protein
MLVIACLAAILSSNCSPSQPPAKQAGKSGEGYARPDVIRLRSDYFSGIRTISIWHDMDSTWMETKFIGRYKQPLTGETIHIPIGPGGSYDLSTFSKALNNQVWVKFDSLLTATNFWNVPERDTVNSGLDGLLITLEAAVKGRYHTVYRWQPQGQILELSEAMARQAGLKDLHEWNNGQ